MEYAPTVEANWHPELVAMTEIRAQVSHSYRMRRLTIAGSDTCNNNGACTGTAVVCPAAAVCQISNGCSSSAGGCTYSNATDGTSCTSGNLCVVGTTCNGGVCSGGTPVTCPIPSDPCKVQGTCSSATGTCTTENAPDGTSCPSTDLCMLPLLITLR